MAHFFLDSAAGSGAMSPVNFVQAGLGRETEVGLWGASVNGQTLTVSTNNGSVAKVAAPGVGAGGNLRHIKLRGLQPGKVMLEARLGPGGPVWASTQVIVSAAAVVATSGLAALAVDIAVAEARRGVFETNNDNRGAQVDQYQAMLGLSGQSWCVCFIYWCFSRAAAQLEQQNPLPRTGAVPSLLTWATRGKRLVDDPQKGDILIVKPSKHAGLVSGAPLASGCVPSIEGNTWAKSTYANRKEGVYELSKQKVESLLFVRV